MALPTAPAIRALVLPQITGTAEDTFLGTQIVAASGALADWCLFPPATAGAAATLEATAHTFYLDGPSPSNPSILVTGYRPITTLTSVKQDTAGVWSYATTESSANYTLDGTNGLIYANPGTTLAWGSGLRYIQVVATVGFNTGAHSVLTQAIGLLVAHWLAVRKTAGVSNLGQGGSSVTIDEKGIPLHVQQLVWPYRLTALER